MRNLGAGGRMVFVNYSLQELISAAYDIQPFQLLGALPWLRSERFDVTARASTNAPLPELNLMLRSLLAERFKLKVRHEQRELPVYFLVKAHEDGRLGPALKPSAADCGPTGRGRGPAPGGGPLVGCRALITPTGVDFEGQTIGQLATVLGMNLRQTVVDQTALSGGYNLKLSFTPPTTFGASPDAVAVDAKLPSLFTALEEQLGLRLVRRTGPIEVLVIDSVERPTPD
jgi:uncharacterized protein (TIGR03435 family)